ncbi:MAG: hypothetical protein COY66_06485 [Candidatus Kerfeldbacteria bacterium CG_4_10_14_0_8_um_filter_42_10]|uniref:HTH arsR-type domain-containing protein n=1 Tax=Candidatus Kerfeldbacteria bacterium CG_4_10_14_0_8_um_filter_42_10 TaxID=2014248 RepID=A0A2M7RFQ4_9BACT|nr:MAG: hypothetical protein COY66_06485 [Candidatus Kerfeldbacteria bacterium CG_4_10_14_0_8_um_filter_42_10]
MQQKCLKCLKVVSIASRFRLFQYLKKTKKPATVSQLVNLLALRQPTVTFHINQLAKLDLIKKEQVGREVYCQISRKCNHCPLFA